MAQHKDREKRPKGCPIDFSAIPDELQKLKQWVMWRFDWNLKSGSWAKVLYQISGKRADSTDPETWNTFDSVMLTFEQQKNSYDGVGLAFANGYCGVDVDECVTDAEGEQQLTDVAARIIQRLDTYTELSPSGTGIHCIGKAKLEHGVNRTWKGNKIEAYSQGRYFTFTGLSWDEKPKPIRNIQADLKPIIDVITASDVKPELNGNGHSVLTLTAHQRLEAALREPKVSSLFHGNIAEYGNDDSAADMALASKLAFYSGGERAMLDSMFRQSKLMRPKWDERRGHDTYGNITMDKAIGNCRNFYGTKKPVEKNADYDSRRVRRFTMLDLKEKALDYAQNGQAQGVHPGWERLREFYRPAKAMLSVVTGEPGSGKSNFVDCLCARIAHKHNWKFTFASFETLPIERHVLTLCQIYLGKPTFQWMQGAATLNELEQMMEALNGHFHFIMPDDHELNIDSILEYVDDDIRDYAIDGFVLDPFTELEQSRFGNLTQTEMIERILRKLQLFTRQRQIHTWLIAHPTKSGDTYKDGRPTMRSISGSANFYNKADFGLVVHRHDDDKTTLHIDKVRFDSNGNRGEVLFGYEKDKREYIELQ